MEKTQYDLDLDALTKESKKIKLNGKTLEVFPSDLKNLFMVEKLAKKFKSVDVKKLDAEKAIGLFHELKDQLFNVVPKLKDCKINLEQLLALAEMVISMAVPSDLKELEKRGISINTKQKKTTLDSSEKLQGSSDSIRDTQSNPS